MSGGEVMDGPERWTGRRQAQAQRQALARTGAVAGGCSRCSAIVLQAYASVLQAPAPAYRLARTPPTLLAHLHGRAAIAN